MANKGDIYKVALPNGDEYNFKDKYVRENYRALNNNDFDTINVTELNSGNLINTGAARFLNPINGVCTDGTNGTTKYMRQDGTWAVPPNDNTTYTLDTNGNNIRLKNQGGTVISTVTAPYATYSGTVNGIYTLNGGVQPPNYFGTNRVGFLMSNLSINNDTHYKNIMYMDCYNGNDVGGTTGLAIDRMEARAWILQADANRTAWNHSAELITSSNIGNQSVNYATSATSATTASKLGTDAGSATNPVYFSGGIPVGCTYSLNKTVPSNAVFTDTTYSAGDNMTLSSTTFYATKRWTAITQGLKWSRILLVENSVGTVGNSGLLHICCTRGNVVCNATFIINTSHASYGQIHQISSNNYSKFKIRLLVNSSGYIIVDIYDTANNIASGATQNWYCSYLSFQPATVTTYTAFTDDSTIPSGYTSNGEMETVTGNDTSAIRNITRSGTTFTATRQNGTTFTFTQQDSNDQFTLDTSGNNVVLSKNGTVQNTITVPYATSAGSATSATQDGSGNTITSTYLKLSGGTMTGVLKTAGADINLGTASTSSDDSADLVWLYGNGSEKMRFYAPNTPTAKFAPSFREFKSDGTSLYNGNLVLGDGTGASGTWGISISGNAATATDSGKLNGYASDTAASNNTIARRTANGYLFATYLNQSSGAETPTSSSYWMYCNSDGYLRKSSLANLKSQIGIGDYLPLAGGILTNTDNVFFPATSTTKIGVNVSSILQSPIPKYLYHDLFSFCKWGIPTYYVTADGSTWTEATLNKKHFASLDNLSIVVISKTGQCGARWVWHSSHFAYSSGEWLIIGVAYGGGNPPNTTILMETSSDGETWSAIHQSTHAGTSAPIWCRVGGHGGNTWLRLTLSKDPSDTEKQMAIGAIKFLATRWGDQGGGSELEYPYYWDENQTISTLHHVPITNNTYDLGTSSLKWATVYATTFNGTATNLSNFQVSTTTNLGSEIGTNTIGYITGLTKADWNYQQIDGAIYGQFYNASWKHMMFADYRTGHMSIRGKNNGVWQNWLQILDSGNVGYEMSSTVVYNPHSKKFTATKTDNAWTAQVYSQQGYVNDVFITFKPSQTTTYIMVGLDSNPSEDANYNKIDYCWYCQANGNLNIYESGTDRGQVTGHTTYVAGDELRVEYSAGAIRYYHNGALCRTVARSISGKLYMDSSFYNSGSIYDVNFGNSISKASIAGSVAWGDVTDKPSTYPPSDHNHGTLHPNFTVTLANTTEDSGWSMINSTYSGFLLKSIRTSGSAPDWIVGNYGSGICFGGSDTKGVLSVAYHTPSIKIAGGNGTKPVWWIGLTGTSTTSYNLNDITNGNARDNTKVAKAGDSMTGVLCMNATGGNNNYDQGIRINAGNNNYSTLTIGTQVNTTEGITDKAFWIGTNRENANLARKLFIAHNGSTASTTYFYASSASDISPSLQVGGTLAGRGVILANTANSGTAGGLGLYGTDPTQYGVIFRTTANQGVHGYVTSDWATYFTMSNTDNRGWVFRRQSSGNVASINTSGNMVLNGSLTVGGNAANTSGVRQVYNSTTQSLDFVFVA